MTQTQSTSYSLIDKDFAEELALSLLEIRAVVLEPNTPFTWTSGWRSPIYCDNRLTMLYPDLRSRMANTFAGFIRENHPDITVITGTSTAGIPHTAWIAERLNMPMSYVRAKAKGHGMGNQIEGRVKKGEHTVVVEDLISTGGSALSVIEALEFIGARVEGLLTIFTYGFDVAHNALEEAEVKVNCLTDYSTLISVASEHGYVNSSDIELLNRWRKNPDTWPKS